MLNELSVVIISNGTNSNLKECLIEWNKDFKLGVDLYICAPKHSLENCPYIIPNNAILDFSTESNFSFPINAKKRIAFDKINSSYIYFIHDRFIPSIGFKNEMLFNINRFQPDFGATDIYNTDGSISLSELRVRNCLLGKTIDDFLLEVGRSSCLKEDDNASELIALNGGQFFLRRNVSHVLERPMHWGEMEDDLMSLDLRPFKGCWFQQPYLVTLTHRVLPSTNIVENNRLKAKLKLYGLLCYSLKLILYFSKYNIISISEVEDYSVIFNENGCDFFIVDPFHKRFTAEYYSSSLEKFTARLRYYTNGTQDFSVSKTFLGWRIFS
jgi:hypothetical protein